MNRRNPGRWRTSAYRQIESYMRQLHRDDGSQSHRWHQPNPNQPGPLSRARRAEKKRRREQEE
jgi:hypothetical protein